MVIKDMYETLCQTLNAFISRRVGRRLRMLISISSGSRSRATMTPSHAMLMVFNLPLVDQFLIVWMPPMRSQLVLRGVFSLVAAILCLNANVPS